MSTIFSPILQGGTNQGQIFAQPSSTPVDNSTANAINAIGGIVKIGTDSYNQAQKDKVLKGLAGEASKYQAAIDQGTMKPRERDAKMAASTSAAIAADPVSAPEIKQTVRAVVGADPTEAQYKDLNHATELEQTNQDTAKTTFVQKSVSEGYVKYLPNGEKDTAAMEQYGIKALARDHALEMQKKATVNAEGRSNAFKTAYEPHYQELANSKLDVLTQAYEMMPRDPVSGLMNPAQVRELGIKTTQGVEASVQQIRSQVISGGGTSQEADYYEKNFRETSTKILQSFTGENADPKLLASNLKFMQDSQGFKVTQHFPTIAGATAAGVKLNPMDQSTFEAGMNKSIAAGESVSSFYATSPQQAVAEDAVSALVSGKPYNTFPDYSKAEIFKTAQSTLKNFGTESLAKATPEQRKAYGLSLNVIGVQSAVPASPQGEQLYADYFNKPEVSKNLATLDSAGDTADLPKQIANNRLPVVEAAIKDAFKKNPKLEFDSKTNSFKDNPYLTSLVRNIDTLYPYSGNPQDIQDYKDTLLKTGGLFD